MNGNATTYSKFGASTDPFAARARDLLTVLSHASDPEDLIAWSMVEYNAYFGRLMASTHSSAQPFGGLLRVQSDPTKSALYRGILDEVDEGSASAFKHVGLELDYYAHCSSPIRRFSDLLNQHTVFQTLDVSRLTSSPSSGDTAKSALVQSIREVNDRSGTVARYHATVDAMELAYEARASPMIVSGRVELCDEDGSQGRLSITTCLTL